MNIMHERCKISLEIIVALLVLAIAKLGPIQAQTSLEPASEASTRDVAVDSDGPIKPVVVHGQVSAPDGKPVEGALLVWDTARYERLENRRKAARTGKDGRYVSPPLPAMKGSITVVAEGFAPDMKPVDFATEREVDFLLKKGETLQIRVVDQNGDPIPGVEVSIPYSQPWRNGANLFTGNPMDSCEPRTGIPSRTDENGWYRWTWAPADEIGFMFEKHDYETIIFSHANPDLMFTAGKDEYTVVMRKVLTISGVVVDAETSDPIPSFHFFGGNLVDDNFFSCRVFWDKDRSMSIRKGGKFEHAFEFPNDKGYIFTVEADGYETYVSRDIMPDEENPTFAVWLKKSDGISGTVLLPDGSPATDANIYLAESGMHLSVLNPMKSDYFRKTHSVTKTNDDGRFTLFNDRTEPYAVYVEHPKGLAWVDRDDFIKSPKIRLRGLAKLELTLPKTVYNDPEDELVLHSDLETKNPDGPSLGGVKYTKKLVAEQTRYTFDSIVAGKYKLILERMKPREERNDFALNSFNAAEKSFEIKEGETKTLDWSDIVPSEEPSKK